MVKVDWFSRCIYMHTPDAADFTHIRNCLVWLFDLGNVEQVKEREKNWGGNFPSVEFNYKENVTESVVRSIRLRQIIYYIPWILFPTAAAGLFVAPTLICIRSCTYGLLYVARSAVRDSVFASYNPFRLPSNRASSNLNLHRQVFSILSQPSSRVTVECYRLRALLSYFSKTGRVTRRWPSPIGFY